MKCRKIGDQSGYCDTSKGSSGLLGLGLLGQSASWVPKSFRIAE